LAAIALCGHPPREFTFTDGRLLSADDLTPRQFLEHQVLYLAASVHSLSRDLVLDTVSKVDGE
jgi:hypothetical protein